MTTFEIGGNDDLLYAEDLAEKVDVRFALGTYAMTEEGIRSFAEQWDPLPLHIAPHGTDTFGGVIASGLHTFAVYQRLAVASVYSRWAIVAGKGARHMQLQQPVFPGDELTGHVTVLAVSPPRRHRAKVTVRGELVNQHGKTVFVVELETYVFCRDEIAHRKPSGLTSHTRTDATTE